MNISFVELSKKLIGSLSRAYGSFLRSYDLDEKSLTLELRLYPSKQERKIVKAYIVSFYKDSYSMKVRVTFRQNVILIILQES